MNDRRLYLTRYMQHAKQRLIKQVQHSALTQGHPPAPLPAVEQSASSAETFPPAPSASAYPPYSTHAVAEALLAESTFSAVPLSSLPATIHSHCSPSLPPPSAMGANSAVVARFQAMCEEPSTALLCRAFDDLHSRGHVVTAGQLYGGDLLLYADEPSSCHAHSVVRLCGTPACNGDRVIAALDLLTVARIASSVSKGAVVAYQEADTDEMSYVSLQWQSSLSAVP